MVRLGLVAQPTGAHTSSGQCTPLDQPAVDHAPHQQPTRWCGHHSSCKASLMPSFSKTCLASSFFRGLVSASTSFSRLVFGTIMPPNLLLRRYYETSTKPCSRHRSLNRIPASASRRKPMISSSEQRLFTSNHLVIEDRAPSRFATHLGGHRYASAGINKVGARNFR